MSDAIIRHAKWAEWLHIGTCYKVRNRGARSVFSFDGIMWKDSYGNVVPRPARVVQFWGGPLNKQRIGETTP